MAAFDEQDEENVENFMNKITTRLLTEQDLTEACKQIAVSYKSVYHGMMDEAYLSSLFENHWERVLKDSLVKGDTGIIAESGGTIIGTAVFGCDEEDMGKKCAAFHAIYLLPEAIGCGAGHHLYCEVERNMQMQGYEVSSLEVLSENIRAIKFYRSHGYQRVSSFAVEENGMVLHCDLMRKRLLLD